MVGAPGFLLGLRGHLSRLQSEERAASASAWKAWAKAAAKDQKGERAALRYVREPLPDIQICTEATDGLPSFPVEGQQAVDRLLEQWGPLWNAPKRDGEVLLRDWAPGVAPI
eukprot:604924-Pyramimonas_sp.AAC.1